MAYYCLIGMVKEVYHPKAYLSKVKNVKRGLEARTRILDVLEKRSIDAKTLANEAEMHYGVAMHHLKLLRVEGIIERKGAKKPRVWVLTGVGQKRLVNSA
jgi:DNA-binding transcriptional ArsR family regulator